MKEQATVKELLSYHNEYLQSQNSFYARLLRSRVQDFYKNNGTRVNSYIDKIKALHAKYYELDEKGERNMREVEIPIPDGAPEGTEPKKKREYILLEGMTVEKYTEEYNELLLQPCLIIW